MRAFDFRIWFFVQCLLFGLILGQVMAGEEKTFTVGKWAYSRLNKAHQFITQGKLNKAMAEMESMQRKKKLNDHERALMWQTTGYIYSTKEKYKKAISSFETCLKLDALPKGAALDTQFNLGQLYMADRQFSKASSVLLDWIGKVENPSSDAKYMLAMALTQTKDWKKALFWSKQAVAGQKKPRETWMQLLLSIHFELKQDKEVAGVLKRLVILYPKKSYWMQLHAIYAKLKQSKRALAVLELVYDQDYLRGHSELTNLASLYLHHGIPIKAARVLEKGIDAGILESNERSLTLLADSWMRAREYARAVAPLQKAAELSKKGDLFVRVSQIHLEREDWAKAAAALNAALDKGDLTDTGNAYLLLGISSFRANKRLAARQAFEKALQYGNTKKPASQWLESLKEKK
jgi:Tfp pilus assembly protein PilF